MTVHSVLFLCNEANLLPKCVSTKNTLNTEFNGSVYKFVCNEFWNIWHSNTYVNGHWPGHLLSVAVIVIETIAFFTNEKNSNFKLVRAFIFFLYSEMAVIWVIYYFIRRNEYLTEFKEHHLWIIFACIVFILLKKFAIAYPIHTKPDILIHSNKSIFLSFSTNKYMTFVMHIANIIHRMNGNKS